MTRKAFDRLAKAYPELQPQRSRVLCAALLHDVGHGPFSHTGEDIFGGNHEVWTRRILSESQPIRQRLDQFHPALAADLQQVYLKQYPLPLVCQLVSSQLDCDRPELPDARQLLHRGLVRQIGPGSDSHGLELRSSEPKTRCRQ